MSETITINLLDPAHGDAMQSWEFRDANSIQIGRDPSNDIVLTDAVVSRKHAEIFRSGTSWSVASHGKNGVIIAGHEITGPTPVSHQTVMRIAASGPYLEFRIGAWLNTPALQAEARRRWAETAHQRPRLDQTITVPHKDLPPRNPTE